MEESEPNLKEIQSKLSRVDTTQIFFTDLNGRARCLTVNEANIGEILAGGVGFDGSSIAGIASVEDSDRVLFPAAESLKIVEFKDETLGFFVGKIFNFQMARSRSDPRAVLEKVLAQAEDEFGVHFFLGPEYEFFLLTHDEYRGDIHTDKAGYFHTTPGDKGEVVRTRIVRTLEKCGIQHEKTHHEVTASQHEINLKSTHPLDAGDRTLLLVHATQRIAAEHGFHATFMPKPFDGENRSAFHIHLSMFDREGNNAFYDENTETKLHQRALHFIGGIVKYARQASIIMASTSNSYKAYVLEREAPVIRGWGLRNRSSMVRVPWTGNPQATRIELRCPDAAGNVYLQMAVLIGMGLQGMRDKLDPGEPDRGSVYKRDFEPKIWDERFLPKCMFEALAEAEKSEFLKDLLGEKLFHNYLDLKTADWEEHRTHITHREYIKYMAV